MYGTISCSTIVIAKVIRFVVEKSSRTRKVLEKIPLDLFLSSFRKKLRNCSRKF